MASGGESGDGYARRADRLYALFTALPALPEVFGVLLTLVFLAVIVAPN
jgi:hypothetical protein